MQSRTEDGLCQRGLAAGKSSDNYNGGSTDKYCWSQTIQELDVEIPVPHGIKKGKDLRVTITSDSLEIRLAAVQGSEEPIVSGELTFPIDKEEAVWNLVPGEAVHLFLTKSKDRWWTALLKAEKPIDLSSVEAVIQPEDLPENEQMKIQELVWNEEQKRKGLPMSGQKDFQEILKQAWDAEGSPFKGTPYNPDLVQQQNFPPDVLESLKRQVSES